MEQVDPWEKLDFFLSETETLINLDICDIDII